MNKNPIHLSQNLSVKLLAEINKLPEHIKEHHKKKAFQLRIFRGDVKDWFKVNRVEENEEQA